MSRHNRNPYMVRLSRAARRRISRGRQAPHSRYRPQAWVMNILGRYGE